jgi:hypothetical protein
MKVPRATTDTYMNIVVRDPQSHVSSFIFSANYTNFPPSRTERLAACTIITFATSKMPGDDRPRSQINALTKAGKRLPTEQYQPGSSPMPAHVEGLEATTLPRFNQIPACTKYPLTVAKRSLATTIPLQFESSISPR